MNCDCVDHLIAVYVNCLLICGQRAKTFIRICLYGMYTVLHCSICTFYYGLLIPPTPKVYTISGIIILVSIPITLFFWMTIELVRKLDESIPIYIYEKQRRHYLHQSRIFRSLVCRRQPSIQEAVLDSPVVSVSVAPQTAFKVTRLPFRRGTPIIRYLRDSSLSSPAVPTGNQQRSLSGHKKLRNTWEEFPRIPGNETKWTLVSLFPDDEEPCKIIKERDSPIQLRQQLGTDTPPTQGALNSMESGHSTDKENENPIPEMDLGGTSPILSAKSGTRSRHSTDKFKNSIPQMGFGGISPCNLSAESGMRSRHSTNKKNKNSIPQMDVRGISPILTAESGMRSRHSTDKNKNSIPQMGFGGISPCNLSAESGMRSRHSTEKNENSIPQMDLKGISPILGAKGRVTYKYSPGKMNENPIPQMNLKGISPIVDAEGIMRSRYSTDEILDPQMNVPDGPPTPGAVGLESRHQTGENPQKLIVKLKGRLRPRRRTTSSISQFKWSNFKF